jgi:Domain of unknown function (DUF4224)
MNTPSIGLTVAELIEVTGFRYPKKQIHALALMEIPFKVRPDGTPFVARVAIEGSPTEAEGNKKTDWVINM